MVRLIVFSIILGLFIGNYFIFDLAHRDGRLTTDEEITISVPPDAVKQDNSSPINPLVEPSEDPVPPFPPS